MVSRNEKAMRWAVLRVLRSTGRPGLLRTRLRNILQVQMNSHLLLTFALLATLSSEDTFLDVGMEGSHALLGADLHVRGRSQTTVEEK